jgi:hypothetical protein
MNEATPTPRVNSASSEEARLLAALLEEAVRSHERMHALLEKMETRLARLEQKLAKGR